MVTALMNDISCVVKLQNPSRQSRKVYHLAATSGELYWGLFFPFKFYMAQNNTLHMTQKLRIPKINFRLWAHENCFDTGQIPCRNVGKKLIPNENGLMFFDAKTPKCRKNCSRKRLQGTANTVNSKFARTSLHLIKMDVVGDKTKRQSF